MDEQWIEDVQKNHARRILDYLPQKTSTWEPNLEWHVLLLFWAKNCENQLCVKIQSMFRVPDLFWLTGAMFRNMSVTHSKFSKRNESPKTGSFCRVRQYVNFSDTPAVSKRSFYVPVRYYIYKSIYINKYYIYIVYTPAWDLVTTIHYWGH